MAKTTKKDPEERYFVFVSWPIGDDVAVADVIGKILTMICLQYPKKYVTLANVFTSEEKFAGLRVKIRTNEQAEILRSSLVDKGHMRLHFLISNQPPKQ